MQSGTFRPSPDRIWSLVHEINNMICSIRMHADCVSQEPRFHDSAHEILMASRQIETRVQDLAALAGNTSPTPIKI
jgi:hypothetical protein